MPDPDDDTQEESLRVRSGEVNHDSPLVSFLYDLIRDHIPAGVVETLIGDALLAPRGTAYAYSNGWLAKYAIDVAERLLGSRPLGSNTTRTRNAEPPICCDALKLHVHGTELKWVMERGYVLDNRRPGYIRFILHLCPWCGAPLPYNEDFKRVSDAG